MKFTPSAPMTFSTGGRLTAILLVLLALWNPSLPLKKAPLDCIILLDESTSMAQEFINAGWRKAVQATADLSADSHFSLIRFGADSAIEIDTVTTKQLQAIFGKQPSPPRTIAINPNLTDIEQSLRRAFLQLNQEENSLILLISDGVETSGTLSKVLPLISEFPTKFYWLRPPRPSSMSRPRILSLAVPNRTLSGQAPPITFELQGDSGLQAMITADLDGSPFFNKKIRFSDTSSLSVTAQLPTLAPGIHLLSTRIRWGEEPDSFSTSRHAVIQTLGPARVLYIGRKPTTSPVVGDLKRGGWPVHALDPAHFRAGLLESTDTIIIDDLPVESLPENAWQQIREAVTRQGKGLLLLGGPHAFGGGGYRGSTLEELLPLISESRIPLPRAAVMFLLDKSGSMGRDAVPAGRSRMTIARQAVQEAVKLLQPEDETGLIVFDTTPTTLLPLATHPDLPEWIDRKFRLQPHGGTRLLPALETAVQSLGKAESKQRIILLISDGYIEKKKDLAPVASLLKEQGIDLVALILGESPDMSPLEQLTRINAGRLLPISEVIQLPSLVHEELLKRRTAIRLGETLPEVKERADFLFGASLPWPPLDGYAVTRAKPDAHIHLVSRDGDPLLASHFAGLGKVVALPAGLDQWAPRWQRWNQWGRLLGGLVEWTSGNRNDKELAVNWRITTAGVKLTIDALEGQPPGWNTSESFDLVIQDPGGRATSLKARLMAPGRFHALFSPQVAGLYHLFINRNGQHHHSGFFYQPVYEQEALDKHPEALESAVTKGIVIPWDPGTPLKAGNGQWKQAGSRFILLLLALFTYLSTLVMEREFLTAPRCLKKITEWKNKS